METKKYIPEQPVVQEKIQKENQKIYWTNKNKNTTY